MQIAKPQVHLRLDSASGKYMIHVITWMDQTKFKEDGYDSLPTTATNGVYTITLRVQEDTSVPNMELLTPIVHTIMLTEIDLDNGDPFIEVKVINTDDSDNELGKRKTHQDDSDETGMPTPKTRTS